MPSTWRETWTLWRVGKPSRGALIGTLTIALSLLVVALASLAVAELLQVFDMRPCLIQPVNEQSLGRLASALRISLAVCLYAAANRLLLAPSARSSAG